MMISKQSTPQGTYLAHKAPTRFPVVTSCPTLVGHACLTGPRSHTASSAMPEITKVLQTYLTEGAFFKLGTTYLQYLTLGINSERRVVAARNRDQLARGVVNTVPEVIP